MPSRAFFCAVKGTGAAVKPIMTNYDGIFRIWGKTKFRDGGAEYSDNRRSHGGRDMSGRGIVAKDYLGLGNDCRRQQKIGLPSEIERFM